MAWRVTEQQVEEIVEVDQQIPLRRFITIANNLTDRIAANDSDGLLGSDDLADIECLLSAHYYSLRDQLYKSRSTADASASFNEVNFWEEAKRLDSTGYLDSLENTRQKLSATWLGKPPSDQTDYVDRN